MIGLISDTHGLLRPQGVAALAGCEIIIHAGDVGKPEILDRLREIAPVVAIRGNVDVDPWADALPQTAVVETGGARLFVLHDVHELAIDPVSLKYDVVVSGHSHRFAEVRRNGVLFVNPGAAGPRRFKLPVTIALLDTSTAPYRVEFVPVG